MWHDFPKNVSDPTPLQKPSQKKSKKKITLILRSADGPSGFPS
jgi:hypothetical protein